VCSGVGELRRVACLASNGVSRRVDKSAGDVIEEESALDSSAKLPRK
jgi:hypothetical protein